MVKLMHNRILPKLPKRRTIRLKEYNYAQTGGYFITICVQERKCIFGDIKNGQMNLNDTGGMIVNNWRNLPLCFSSIELDKFIIMPNHLHGIIQIVGAPLVGARNVNNVGVQNNDRAGTRPAPTIGDIIGAFKSITTGEYIKSVKDNNWQAFNKRLWQRNYYEHVIRDEGDLTHAREYIISNSAKWQEDEYYFQEEGI